MEHRSFGVESVAAQADSPRNVVRWELAASLSLLPAHLLRLVRVIHFITTFRVGESHLSRGVTALPTIVPAPSFLVFSPHICYIRLCRATLEYHTATVLVSATLIDWQNGPERVSDVPTDVRCSS